MVLLMLRILMWVEDLRRENFSQARLLTEILGDCVILERILVIPILLVRLLLTLIVKKGKLMLLTIEI